VGSTDANLALVRRAYDAWNRNDWEELEAIYHPGVTAVAPEGFMESTRVRGWPDLRERYRELKAAWDEESLEVEEVATEGAMVAARVKWQGVGRASGAPISLQVTNLVEISGGQITRLEYFWTYEDALDAMRERVAAAESPAAEPAPTGEAG
jgi:ketosteroid isomerase-like protein